MDCSKKIRILDTWVYTYKNKKESRYKIGDHICIGSSCKFALGVNIGSIIIVVLGSIVSNSFKNSRNIIVDNPVRIVKKNIDWRDN